MKHQFADELRIKVVHEHEVQVDEVDALVDKVVEGAVTIIAVGTAAYIFKEWLT